MNLHAPPPRSQKPTSQPPVFEPNFDLLGEPQVPEGLRRQIRNSVIVGCIFSAIFVFGLLGWAALSTVAGAVTAPGMVRVENNRKSLKHLEPGIIRQILVHEGDHVKQGQLLFVLDDTQARSQLDQLENNHLSLLAQRARFEAELLHKPAIDFPPEVLARRADPAVAALIQDQQSVFQSRRDVRASQGMVNRQRIAELNTQIAGLRAQVTSIDSQDRLNTDELEGLQTLYKGGYAPKTRVLALQRSAAQFTGSRGQEVADIAKAEQSIGETRSQLIQTEQQLTAEAAEGLRDSQDKIADLLPKLVAARENLNHTQVRSPAAGYVLNQTQFTEGGVIGSDEPLLDVVPDNVPLVVDARVSPKDAHAVRPGMKALITLAAYNTRTTPQLQGEVLTVSADQLTDSKTGQGYFTARLKIDPKELKRLPSDVKLYPGLPTQTMIVTGHRSIMDFLVGPLREALSQSMHEQ